MPQATMTTKMRRLSVAPSVLSDYNDARADALPISRAVNLDYFMRYFSWGDPNHDPESKASAKVSLWRLLSYSTVNERWLMIFGILLATVSGLGIPTWLVLLNRSLDEFSNLATLMNRVGGDGLMELVQEELKNLCIAFAIVGVVCLVTGTLYVSIWTYTGEKQALRIQSQFVRSSINQDAAWFDRNDREALPTKMGTALVHINNAIGRHVVDVYSNAISAIGCLVVALLLNAALSLVILCVVPIAMIIMALINIYIRRVKTRANKAISKAGGIATETLSGIKTVASLCAQPYFGNEYQQQVRDSARSSVRASALSSLSAGVTESDETVVWMTVPVVVALPVQGLRKRLKIFEEICPSPQIEKETEPPIGRGTSINNKMAPPFGQDSSIDALRSEILQDYRTLTKGELSKKWYFAEGKPSMREYTFPAVEKCVSRYVVDIEEKNRITFYKQNVQVVCNITPTTRELMRDYVSILFFYMRMPTKKDTVATRNVFRSASPIRVYNSMNIRTDIDPINPSKLPIFRNTAINCKIHKRFHDGVERMLCYLGKHPEDAYAIYAIKYQQSESMGLHGDFGGSKSEKGICMRLSLGVGSRNPTHGCFQWKEY